MSKLSQSSFAKKEEHPVTEPAAERKAAFRRGIKCKKRPAATWRRMGWWGHSVAYRNLTLDCGKMKRLAMPT